jgi:hypothetical protein
LQEGAGGCGQITSLTRFIGECSNIFGNEQKKNLRSTQLNSDVIRAFKKAYRIDSKPELQEVVSDEVDFHAHVVIKWDIKNKLWEKVGNATCPQKLDLLFRDTNDVGSKFIKISNNWYVWRINEDFQHVGRLEGDRQKAEIGVVVRPRDIVDRMRTGDMILSIPGTINSTDAEMGWIIISQRMYRVLQEAGLKGFSYESAHLV